MSLQSRAQRAVLLPAALLLSCARPATGPAPAASGAAPAADASVRPTLPAGPGVFITPAPAPEGAVSEIRVVAGVPPAQVTTTLGGRKGSGPGTERDCGSGPAATVQCADLVVAGIPRSVAKVPQVRVYAKRHADLSFAGPCHEIGDSIDCALALKGTPGASLLMVGRKPRLEVKPNGFALRWRAMNLASDACDVKLVVSF